MMPPPRVQASGITARPRRSGLPTLLAVLLVGAGVMLSQTVTFSVLEVALPQADTTQAEDVALQFPDVPPPPLLLPADQVPALPSPPVEATDLLPLGLLAGVAVVLLGALVLTGRRT